MGGLDNFTSWAAHGVENPQPEDEVYYQRNYAVPLIDRVQENNRVPQENYVGSVQLPRDPDRLNDLQLRIMRARQKNIQFKKSLAERILTSSSYYTPSSNEMIPFRERVDNSNLNSDETRFAKIGSNIQAPPYYSYASSLASNEQIPIQSLKNVPISNKLTEGQERIAHKQQLSERDPKVTMESKNTPMINQQNTIDQQPDENISVKLQKSPQRHREQPRKQEQAQIISQSAALAPLLKDLVRDMNTVIEENTRGMEDFLSTTSTNDQAQRLKMERERRKGVREKIDSLLASHGSKQQLKIPLWRHRMLGVQSPPPETILRVSELAVCVDYVLF